MDALSWYGIAALAVLAPAFYFVRKIPAYLALCVLLVAAFAAATWRSVNWAEPSAWIVTLVGLMLCAFGLLIVRVMLIRSVSLLLLAEIKAGLPGTTDERLRDRPRDMRAFGLIRPSGERSVLTGFGSAIGALVAGLYALFGIAK